MNSNNDNDIDPNNHCCISTNKLHHKIFNNLNKYRPLIIIIIFCLIIPLIQYPSLPYIQFMDYFMGYFLIILSLFKFLDLKAFVLGFSKYDLIAKKITIYGYLYPFIELSLGLSYLGQFNVILVNIAALFIMTISGLGVIRSILSGQKIKCACLGSLLNVPLGMVSLIENFGMALMAGYHLHLQI